MGVWKKAMEAKFRRGTMITRVDTGLTPDDVEFGKAMEDYKRKKDRPFPTWHEVLDVLLSLGYRKTAAGNGS